MTGYIINTHKDTNTHSLTQDYYCITVKMEQLKVLKFRVVVKGKW